MPHKPNHGRYGSDNTEADKINKAKKTKQKSIDVRKSAYDTFKGTGISGIGGADVETRKARSIASGWTPPKEDGGGRITETKPDGKTIVTTFDDDDDDKGKTEKVKKQYDGEETLLNKIFGNKIMRLTPSQLRRVKKILAEYQKLGVTNPAKLRSLMFSNIGGGLLGQDQRFSDKEGNIIKEDDIIFQDGKMFFKDEDGELQPVRRTKEGTIDLLKEEGSDIMKSLKKFYPELYYPFKGQPGTSGGLVDLARLPTTGDNAVTDPKLRQMIFDARQDLDRQGKNPMTGNPKKNDQQAGGGGIGDFQTTPPPTTDPTTATVPDFLLKRQYMPGFTPNYLGGPEQMQVAGGYWDPTTKKWITGGGPYGTTGQYQFNQGGIVGTSPLLFKNQGGMASDNGIKSFKKYGY